jgi:hypothetical protein
VRCIVTRVLFLAATGLAVSGTASAQPAASDADRATARALAREGADAQKREQYALAADRFERAEALVDAPTLLLGLARAQVGLGKLVEANETYRRILREPLAPHASAPFVAAVKSAAREDAEIASRLAWVTLVVNGPTTAEVLLDDVPVSAAALGVPLACNPGAHAVKASAEGFASGTTSFALSEGGKQTVSVTLRAQPVQPVQPPPAPVRHVVAALVSPPAAERTSSFQTKLGVGVLGLGIAGLGVGGVTGILVLTRRASLRDACPDGHCSPSYAGELNTYRTLANVSTIATIAGATGAAAGIVLLLTSPQSTSVNVYAGALSGGIAGRF